MKVLWITNIVFPEALEKLTGVSSLKSTGGWMLGAAEALMELPNIELRVATVSNRVRELTTIEGDKIIYYIIPSGNKYSLNNTKINNAFEPYWNRISLEYHPDVTHIHGTENSHGLSYLNACGSEKCVISIQGLTSCYSKYYYYGLSKWQIIKNLSLSDILRNNSILSAQKGFRRRGEYEKEMIRKVRHIIGRTDWDESHIWAINPLAEYHFCNETLRPEFYCDYKWNYENCRKHTIFLSQGNYPIKGLHQVLYALPFIINQYPDVQVRIAGKNIIQKPNNLRELFFYSGYGNIIKDILKKHKIENHVSFLGNLESNQMRDEYLKSNLFVCPSSIENSPNSLGEAQILGVPVISSYVGGSMNLIPSPSCGELYRFDEIEMLAWKVCKMFDQSKNFDNIDMIKEARQRHDRENNAINLLKIYEQIANENR